MAEALDGRVLAQVLEEALDAGIHFLGIVAAEFHQVEPRVDARRPSGKYSATLCQTYVLHGQQQDLGIHRARWTAA